MELWRLKKRFCVSYRFDMELSAELKSRESNGSFVFDMYDYFLPRMSVTNIEKVVLDFYSDHSQIVEPYSIAQVLVVPTLVLVQEVRSKSSEELCHFWLELMHGKLLGLASEWGWSEEGFREAYSIVEAKKLRFAECWKNPVSNSTRRFKACVCWEYSAEIKLYVKVIDVKECIEKRYLISVLPPTLGALQMVLGRFKWVEDDKVELQLKNGRDSWQLNVTTGQLDFHYPRAINGDAHGQYDLGVMYLEGRIVLENQLQASYWLKKSADQGFKRAIGKLTGLSAQ